MSIKPLNKETIKLINSTQVITSIYSAIKELVENSLDAQAENIEINLVDNGLSLIEVKDNGIGVNREDAQYMALPSYTSKITNFDDLDLLSSYGFRGEGLASICQVSDVKISTKTNKDETMICHTLDNEGHVAASELSHGLTGTTVQMKNLFKNMPVRRNILNNKKRINQEIKAVEILLKTFAICKPSVRILLRVNRNIIFTKPSCKNTSEALQAVLGMQTFSKLTCIKKNISQTEIQLFIPKKEIKDCTEISQVGIQFLCVNNRPVKSKEIEKKINKRISEYFEQSTSHSRKFIFCATLKVDPSMLDVNLEPNKDKVFLQNELAVLTEIDNALLNFYDLQNSQLSTQNVDENVNNGNIINLEKDSDISKEWSACKKRKVDSQKENIHDIVILNKTLVNVKKYTDKTSIQSDNDFIKSISGPVLSDSDSNDGDEINKMLLKKKSKIVELMDIQENEEENSESLDIAQDVQTANEIIEETLSQLPNVDLGEDFVWEEIINKSHKISIPNAKNTGIITNQQIDDVTWSKGQVPGLQGGVTVGINNNINNLNLETKQENKFNIEDHESESLDITKDVSLINGNEELPTNENIPIPPPNEFHWDLNRKKIKRTTPTKTNNKLGASGALKQSRKSLNLSVDRTQTKIPFAGDNACLSAMGPSAFAMYCATERSKILKQHPELTPPEVAVYMNKRWKELPSEEREYYRDLVNQHNLNASNSSLSQTLKKPKSQPTEAEKEKNKKQLINMLGNMKMNKTELKNKSMFMRTFVSWDINLELLAEKFKNRRPEDKDDKTVVGKLNSLLWIISITSNLFIFDISEVHAQLDVKDYDISQINANYVKNLINQWFVKRGDTSIFHPFYSTKA